jgi:tyrosyl-tRNA synthetase
MGKTEKGTIWMDKEKTSPYELFQYLRNVDDRDVEKFLALLTFLPMDEVRRLGALEGAEINKAKEVLAYEVTSMIHGKDEADGALRAAKALFADGMDESSIPSTQMDPEMFKEGVGILDLMREIGMIKSNSEGRRLVQQGGVTIDGEKVEAVDRMVTANDFKDGKILIKKGKKTYHQVQI